MARKGIEKQFPYLRMLSEKQVEDIHKATMDVLMTTGVRMDSDKALDILEKAGATVDRAEHRVRIPENMVTDALANTPHELFVKARNPENSLNMVPGKTTYFMNSCGFDLHDPETGTNFTPSRKEFYDYVRLIDAMPNVDLQDCFPTWGFAKVPQCMRLLESNAAKLRVSDKAMMEGTVLDNYKFIIEMAEATDQDILQLVNPLSPLTYTETVIEQMFYTADHDQPYHLCPGPVAATNAPCTVAGLLAEENAVILAGIVLAQLYKPNTRLWVGSLTLATNMASLAPCFGDVLNSIAEAGFVQIWNDYYRIPCWTSASAWTNSKRVDYQAGYELTLGMLVGVLSGSNMVSYQGGLTAELSVCVEKLLVDDDVAGMVKRLMQGIEVSEDTLALETIDEVGPMPGSFITTEHTLDFWEMDTYLPKVADRTGYEQWMKAGMPTAVDHAKDRKKQILDSFEDKKLTDEQEKAIEDILQKAREYYRANGTITDEEWAIYQEDLNSPNYPYA